MYFKPKMRFSISKKHTKTKLEERGKGGKDLERRRVMEESRREKQTNKP
jgi:hypothetical protein